MNKVVKRKLIGSVICIILSVCIFVYLIVNYSGISEELHSYMSGFAGGVFGVGIITLFMVIRAIINPNKGTELENSIKDERLIRINNATMAITFKISIILEALISIIGALTNRMEISMYIGFAICFQLIVYLITYIFVKRSN